MILKKKMEKKQEKEKPALRILGEMEIGDIVEFPAYRLNSIKTMCSTFGFIWDKKFRTSANRDKHVTQVTRVL